MKKRGPSPLVEEEMSKELEAGILRRTAPQLFEMRSRAEAASFKKRAFALLFSGGLAAALAITIWVRQPAGKPVAEAELASLDLEMLEQLDLLKEMRMLENDDLLNRVKENKGWQKERKGT